MDAVLAKNLRKTFPNGALALQGIDLSVAQGEIFGILGPNGAGKTTFMNILATLLVPDEGDVWIQGESVTSSARSVRKRINLCSGNANFAWSLTVRENLNFYAMLYGLRQPARARRLEELMAAFSLTPYADRRFDEISTGTKQRLALAKSLLNEPPFLLLDEPTVGLDPDMALRVRNHIRDYQTRTGCTLILTTHYMQEAESLCRRIAFIREGRILALGTPAELKEKMKASDLEGVFLELAK